MRTLATLAALLLACACRAEPEPQPPEQVRAADVEGIAPLHAVGELHLAGQPTPEAFRELAERGTTVVIDLRLPGEDRAFDEAELVTELGMEYTNPGFRSPDELTDDVFDEVRRLLREHAGETVLLHCGSSNRVGAVWLAARVLDDGVPWEAALEEAHRVGLRSEGHEARVRAYVAGPRGARWLEVKAEIRAKFPDVERITVEELFACPLDEAPILLDARAVEEYAVSHLHGARRAATEAEALAVLEGLPTDREIVVYCSVGYRSAMLAERLTDEGFSNVRNLEGSIFEWANAGHTVYRDAEPVRQVHPYDEDWGQLLDRKLWPDADDSP